MKETPLNSPFMVNSIHLIDAVRLNVGLLETTAAKDQDREAEVRLNQVQLNQIVQSDSQKMFAALSQVTTDNLATDSDRTMT